MRQRSSVRLMDDKGVWKIKSESRYWDDKKLTSAEGFVLECPFGHQLSVRARPAGLTKDARFIHCQDCAQDENGEYPKWDLPPGLK